MPTSVQCQICSGSETRRIQNTFVRFSSAEIDLVKCARCGLVYLNPQPDENQIGRLYSDEYFIKWYSSEKKREFSKKFFLRLFRGNGLMTKGGGNLLEIGCGMGFFLEVAREWKWNVKGVEISPYASSHCRKMLGFDVHNGTLETAGYQSGYFDIITAFDVLEHLTDLPGFMSFVKKILKKDGRFVVIVPNYDSPVFQLDRIICGLKKAPLPNVPEHLTYFTRGTLKRLFEGSGLVVENIFTVPANDEGEYLWIRGGAMAVLRSVLNNVCYQFGKLSSSREAILAIARKA